MESSEFSREGGIPLVSPGEKLEMKRHDGEFDEFSSIKREVPDLGTAYLVGTRTFQHPDDDWGVTIIEDQIAIKRIKELIDVGLFEVGVNVDGLRTNTTCNVILPEYNLDLYSDAELMTDELEKDPEKQYWGFADEWRMRGDDRTLFFFAPADSKFLSQLQFSFHADLPPTQS